MDALGDLQPALLGRDRCRHFLHALLQSGLLLRGPHVFSWLRSLGRFLFLGGTSALTILLISDSFFGLSSVLLTLILEILLFLASCLDLLLLLVVQVFGLRDDFLLAPANEL